MYRHLLSAAFILGLLLFSVSVQAYGGDGSVAISGEQIPSSGVCNDGNDNDGDGLTDGEDTGCTGVYSYDRSEYDMRDSDLSYELYGDEELNPGDLSIAQPGFVERSLDVILEDCRALDADCAYSSSVGAGSPQLVEYSIDSLGYAQWAGGELKNIGVSVSDSGVAELDSGEADRDTYGAALADNPVFGSITEDPEVETCGNGDRNMNEGKNTGCPQDWGLPDDLTVDGEPRTAEQSSTDITDELKNSFTVNVGINHGASVEQSDYPDYTMDLEGLEPSGEYTINIQSPGEEPREEEYYEHDGITEAPDFFADGREIKAVYPYAEETTYTQEEVMDTDLVVEEGITNYERSGFEFYTDCDIGGDGSNVSCDPTGTSYCTDADVVSNTVRNYSLQDDTKIINIDTKAYRTQQTDNPTENPGYREDISDRGLTVNVERDISAGYDNLPADNCPTETNEMECDFEPGNSDSCSPTDQEAIYLDEEPDYTGEGYGTSYTTTESHETDIVYESMEFREETVFSTDYLENEGLPSETDSVEALFNDDYNLEDVEYNGVYYTIEPDYHYGDFSNSPAASSSSFEVTVQDGQFHSKRDYYGVFNVDGPSGFGDSFIALKNGQITQEIPAFNRETAIVSPSGEKVGNSEGFLQASEQNFVGLGDYSSPGECPNNFIFCVAAVDLSIQEWSNWNNPTQPEFEFETIDKVHVNQSFGACRKYQELIGGARNSILRCQYDYAEDFPSEPVPFHKPELVGGGDS